MRRCRVTIRVKAQHAYMQQWTSSEAGLCSCKAVRLQHHQLASPAAIDVASGDQVVGVKLVSIAIRTVAQASAQQGNTQHRHNVVEQAGDQHDLTHRGDGEDDGLDDGADALELGGCTQRTQRPVAATGRQANG